MAINKPAIDYANARIDELKQVYTLPDIEEAELFDLLIEAFDSPNARRKVNEFAERLEKIR